MSIVEGFRSRSVIAVPPTATSVIFLLISLSSAVRKLIRVLLSSGIVQPHLL